MESLEYIYNNITDLSDGDYLYNKIPDAYPPIPLENNVINQYNSITFSNIGQHNFLDSNDNLTLTDFKQYITHDNFNLAISPILFLGTLYLKPVVFGVEAAALFGITMTTKIIENNHEAIADYLNITKENVISVNEFIKKARLTVMSAAAGVTFTPLLEKYIPYLPYLKNDVTIKVISAGISAAFIDAGVNLFEIANYYLPFTQALEYNKQDIVKSAEYFSSKKLFEEIIKYPFKGCFVAYETRPSPFIANTITNSIAKALSTTIAHSLIGEENKNVGYHVMLPFEFLTKSWLEIFNSKESRYFNKYFNAMLPIFLGAVTKELSSKPSD